MNKQQIFAFLFLCLFCINLSQAADISAVEEWQIKQAVKELSDSYAITRDNNDYQGYANTFTKDGSLILYGSITTGREAIQARAESGSKTAVRMHIMTSSAIEVIDREHATGVHYATIYSGEKSESHQEGDIVVAPNYRVMGKYHDKYVLTDAGWKFAERRLEPIFRAIEQN